MTFGSAGALACASIAVHAAGAGEGARTYRNYFFMSLAGVFDDRGENLTP